MKQNKFIGVVSFLMGIGVFAFEMIKGYVDILGLVLGLISLILIVFGILKYYGDKEESIKVKDYPENPDEDEELKIAEQTVDEIY